MKLIRIEDNEFAVVAEIRITGHVLWRFEYVVDDYSITRKGDDGENRRFALGLPEELDGDASAWIFNLVNVGNKETKYSTTIRWMQGEKKIASWSGRGSVKAGKIATKSGEAMFVVRKGVGS
jgi:hypothetical protein